MAVANTIDPKKLHKMHTGMNGYYEYNDYAAFTTGGLTAQIAVPFATVEGFNYTYVQASAAAADPPLEIVGAPDSNGMIAATPNASGGYYITVGRSSSVTSGLGFMYSVKGR